MDKIVIRHASSLSPLVQELSSRGGVYVVYDSNLASFAAPLTEAFPSFAITADEEHKSIDAVMDICRFLMDGGADRGSLLVAVGGGVTTDLAGFAACIYKRGIAYVNVPTTLLAMVDAAVGGKTGANVDSYKNMIGVIRQPLFTFICPPALRTLPHVQMLSGAAEMLKTFLLGDAVRYRKALEVLSVPDGNYDMDALEELIFAAASFKAAIVEEDEFENGRRRLLNLGHTWGHAIEWWQHSGEDSGKVYTHGEAVAIGIIQAARMSEAMGIACAGLEESLKVDFEACGLPTELPCPPEELEAAIRQDKKAENGKVNFVLLEDIGKPVVVKV